VDWILICKLCKFGKSTTIKEILFPGGGYFFRALCISTFYGIQNTDRHTILSQICVFLLPAAWCRWSLCSLMKIDLSFTMICAKNNFCIFGPRYLDLWTFNLLRLNKIVNLIFQLLFSRVVSSPRLKFLWLYYFEEIESTGQTDGRTDGYRGTDRHRRTEYTWCDVLGKAQ